MPQVRADYYRKKRRGLPILAAASKHAEVEESWHKLAAQWERLARGIDASAQRAHPEDNELPMSEQVARALG
jgi:hypothetical protein